MPAAAPKVVIAEAGLGGLAAERAMRRMPVAVTAVDAHNYSTFPPLLFEAAVGVIVPEDVARPIRSFLGRRANTTFRLGEVIAIDWETSHVALADGDELPFNHLIIAPGVVPWYGAVPGAAEHAVPLKTVTDAARTAPRSCVPSRPPPHTPTAPGPRRPPLRSSAAEPAASSCRLSLRRTVALVRPGLPEIPRERMRLIVVDVGDRLLPGFAPRLSRYAEAALRRRGVDVRLRTRVERIDGDGLVLGTGERVSASTVVWAGGVSAPARLTDPAMASEDGRLVVDADLRLAAHPNVFAIGDAAAVRSRSGPLQPQVAQVAVQGAATRRARSGA